MSTNDKSNQPLWDIHAEPNFIYTTGHFDPQAFVDKCAEWDDCYTVRVEDVKHCHARWIPVWGSDYDSNGNFYMIPGDGLELHFPYPAKRGAFPITYAEDWHYADESEDE